MHYIFCFELYSFPIISLDTTPYEIMCLLSVQMSRNSSQFQIQHCNSNERIFIDQIMHCLFTELLLYVKLCPINGLTMIPVVCQWLWSSEGSVVGMTNESQPFMPQWAAISIYRNLLLLLFFKYAEANAHLKKNIQA